MDSINTYLEDNSERDNEKYHKINDVISNNINKALDSIWFSLEEIIKDVESGQCSNREIADKIKELQDRI